MAAWSTPHTAVTGEVTTAAQWNAEVRDNPTSLYEAYSGQMFKNESQGQNYYTMVANQANLVALVMLRKATITGYRFLIGTSSGNLDVGIYDSAFTRLWSRGSFASPGTGAREVLISAGSPTTLTLTPGLYYTAFAADNTTVTFVGVNQGVTGILKIKATSFPLPSAISTPSDSTTGTAPVAYLFQ